MEPKRKKLAEMEPGEFADTLFNPRRRVRFAGMAIDFFVAATLLLVAFLILSIPFKLIDYSKGFTDQYNALLESSPLYAVVTVFVYDTVCQLLFHRSLGNKIMKFRMVPSSKSFDYPFITPLLRRIIRSGIYSNILFFAINAFVLLFVPPFKTIEDHIFRFDIAFDDEESISFLKKK